MSKVSEFDITRKIKTGEEEDEYGWIMGDFRLTVLTFSILGLVLMMLVMIGEQAITTERTFFRKVALRTNQKIADLIAQQFVQVFSNTTGLVEDVAHFPSVVGMDYRSCDYLFQLILKRHPIFRAIYILPLKDIEKGRRRPSPDGNRHWEWFNTNVDEYRQLGDDVIEPIVKKMWPSRQTEYYAVQGVPALTYACAIRDRRRDKVVGILAAEMELGFIQPVIDGAELGRTGDVLVVNKSGRIIFSTRGFTDVEDFAKNFPIDMAYRNNKGGVETRGRKHKLASYTRIRQITTRRLLPGFPSMPFPSTVTPREVPDWLIVVLQDAAEGYLVADRLKWNIIILLVIGAVGVAIIGKLWVDSR